MIFENLYLCYNVISYYKNKLYYVAGTIMERGFRRVGIGIV